MVIIYTESNWTFYLSIELKKSKHNNQRPLDRLINYNYKVGIMSSILRLFFKGIRECLAS